MDHPETLGQLKKSGYRYRSVKDELRENLICKLRSQEPLFPGIIGYDDTVLPQIVHAVLSRHDMLFLGLRGQAKSRILRALPQLLDEYIPVVAGLDVADDPLAPAFRQTKEMIASRGDETPIRWLHREERYHEKLATPDVTIADLIGEIDLVKHAEGRYLADENIIHYGLIPRTNRGIFAINELPDLSPRIQVGLFNVMEERDVQIRGFPVRLPMDLCMAFSANPEDYTNRGRIVTPLKDRIGSVIRTHYPVKIEDAMEITRTNAWLERGNGTYKVSIPAFMLQVVEEMIRLARRSPHVSQQSGVSVRTSIASVETMVSSAEKRAILHGESVVVPRMSDLGHVAASCRGKIELMLSEDEAAEDKLIQALLGEAVKNVFEQYMDAGSLENIVGHFQGGKTSFEFGDDVPSREVAANLRLIPGLKKAASKLCEHAELDDEEPGDLASAVEFILEALHVNNRLSKYTYRGRTYYRK
jgi:magnesium chelatase subunit I